MEISKEVEELIRADVEKKFRSQVSWGIAIAVLWLGILVLRIVSAVKGPVPSHLWLDYILLFTYGSCFGLRLAMIMQQVMRHLDDKDYEAAVKTYQENHPEITK